MFQPDFKMMGKVYEGLVRNDVPDVLNFLAISHIATNGFTKIQNGLFGELIPLEKPQSQIDVIIDNSVDHWVENITIDAKIDEQCESVIRGSQYTDIDERILVLNYYKQLIEGTYDE